MLWLLVLITIVGFILLFLGVRGRVVGDEPRCRGCRFDLSGLNIESAEAVCPECAAKLAEPMAIRVGLRKRRRSLVLAGVLLLVPALGAVVAGSNWTGWNNSKPLSILKLDVMIGTASVSESAAQEIISRLNLDELSASQRAGLTAVAARRLGRGSDAGIQWYEIVLNERINGKIRDSTWGEINTRMILYGRGFADRVLKLEEPDYFGENEIEVLNIPGEKQWFLTPGLAMNSAIATPLEIEVGFSLLYVLDRIDVEGQPLALRNVTEYKKKQGKQWNVRSYEFGPSGVSLGWTYRFENAPHDYEAVLGLESRENNETLTDGLPMHELSAGDHDAMAYWTAYIGLGNQVLNTSDPKASTGNGIKNVEDWNTPLAPVYGPFEIARPFVYRVFDRGEDIYTEVSGEEKARLIKGLKSSIKFEPIEFKPHASLPVFHKWNIAYMGSSDLSQVGLIGTLCLEIDGTRYPLRTRSAHINLQTGVKTENLYELSVKPYDKLWGLRRNGLWIHNFPERATVADVIFIPQPERFATELAPLAGTRGGPVPVLNTEVRWKNVEIIASETWGGID